MLPQELKIGDSFTLRPTKNARKYRVSGLVLKITKLNGFKYILPENAGKIMVPTERGELLILDPEKEIYTKG